MLCQKIRIWNRGIFMNKPKLLFYNSDQLLEGPCWDKKNNVLYFVSILNCRIYAIDPYSGELNIIKTEGPVGCAVVEENGSILEAELSGIYRINPITGEKKYITNFLETENVRYNDGKLGPNGRFYVGSMFYNQYTKGSGKLFCLDGREKKILIENTTISNGLGFSNDEKYMYFIDTPTKRIGRYFYDKETGNILFDKYVVEIQGEGMPDGMCVARDDTIWVAEWGAGKVSHWNPATGKKIEEIMFPCLNVSSCCFGGEKDEFLFVTTGKHDDGTESEELAGGLFFVKI